MILPPSWKPHEPEWEGLSTDQLGNVPFSLLKPASCSMRYGRYPWSVIYYCETAMKRLLLSRSTRTKYICVNMYICPLEDFSMFIENLAFLVYAPGSYDCLMPSSFAIDNSQLYSLLDGIPTDQYALILENYITDLDAHMEREIKYGKGIS